MLSASKKKTNVRFREEVELYDSEGEEQHSEDSESVMCDVYVCDELVVQADLDNSAERRGNPAEQCKERSVQGIRYSVLSRKVLFLVFPGITHARCGVHGGSCVFYSTSAITFLPLLVDTTLVRALIDLCASDSLISEEVVKTLRFQTLCYFKSLQCVLQMWRGWMSLVLQRFMRGWGQCPLGCSCVFDDVSASH